jgi:hypothetical protein
MIYGEVPRDNGGWMSGLFLFSGIVLATIALYAWEHAGDEPRFSAGVGSGLSPAGRRVGAACVFLIATGCLITALTY